MAYDDKDLGRLFPVRHGIPTGSANERKMLDAIQDTGNFRTRIETHPDGSVTTLRTKGGMPQFETVKPEEVPDEKLRFYMETGQLQYQYPGEFVATRLDPATIKYLDIPTTDDYLCYISGKSPSPGTQKNREALFDGMNSLAIGYPVTGDAEADSDTREKFKDALLMKKITALHFQSSLWSGKMRLFLQAQFGAKMLKDATKGFYSDVFGDTLHLKYKKDDTIFQFGLWPHKTPGLFSAPDDTWWVIDITGGPSYAVTAYKLKQNEAGKKLLRTYRSTKESMSIAEREKLEGYIFAHSIIEVDNPVAVGTFTSASGFTLAYGWKFNRNGSKASIVLHNQTGGVGSTVWNSYTLHLTIFYADGAWGCSCAQEANGEWTDGWGAYNIFAPVDELGGELISKSIAMDTANVKPAFVFPSTPIYGWYDAEDAWITVKVGRSYLGSATYYEQEGSGLVTSVSFMNRYDPDYFYAHGTLPPDNPWNFSIDASFAHASAKRSNEDAYHELRTCNKKASMNISIAGWSFSGERVIKFVNVSKSEITSTYQGFTTIPTTPHYTCTPQSNDCGNGNHAHPGYNPATGSGNLTGLDLPVSAPMVAIVADVLANFSNSYYNYNTHWTIKTDGTNDVSTWSQDEDHIKRWTLVIPTGDCSSAYVATQDAKLVSRGAVTTKRTGQFHHNFLHIVVEEYLNGGEYSYVEYDEPWAYVYPFPNGSVIASAAVPATPETPPEIKAWNTKISAAPGAFSNTTYMLFNVDYHDPTYPPGMTMHTSHNLRYTGSEVSPDPVSVISNLPFVGWA